MLTERLADAVVVRAPAKVNLFLEVLARRPDGYHEIASLMVAVGLCDVLEFRRCPPEPEGVLRLVCGHPELSTGPDNLVWRAARMLQERTGCRRSAEIRLTKRIPLAAGLAGGSSDAAATLAGLNQLWQLGLTRPELAALGAEIGSDVAFFFDTPAAWCTGRGEVVTPLTLGRPLDFVLVCPPVGLSTAMVYRGVTVPEHPQTGVEIRRAAERGDLEEIGRRLHNRLQPVAERLCPEVAVLHSRLAAGQPLGQAMSGSGTSLFALCRDRRAALRLTRELRRGSVDAGPPRRFIVRSCV
jgi:4-diphosphocytidyl-2-C-methyl-D-erythritol kinase